MRLRSNSKIWASVVVCLVIAQAVASLLLPKSYRLTAITDSISFFLMVSASLAFTRNAFNGPRRQRLVWILLGGGYAIESCSQILWMHWELVVKQTPAMSLGDAGVFLAWIIVILGFALRPHVEPTPQHQRLGTLDLLLLLMAGLYLYLFLVIPWQYLAPEPHSYGPAYKFLALAEDVVLLSIVAHGWLHSSGRWRHFYALLTCIVAFDTVMEYFVDTLAEAGVYFSGSWYDSTTAACLAGMTFAALMAHRLEPASERSDPDSERYWRWASRLAAPVTLILPLLAAWSFLDRSLPDSIWKFRVVLSLAAVVVFAFVGIVKQARLENELANANHELLDASLTDLLTGVRNRRFFTNSIEADVQQVMRSFVSNPSADLRNRDMVFYLIDIDHFKKVNDQFGHKIGDLVLTEVARRINSAARLSDAVIRWGGEEFLLLSRYTDRKEAHTLANRILDSVGSRPYRVEGADADMRITCSIGWAVFPWVAIEPKLVDHEQVLVLSDYALYQAKGSGRNRAVGLLPAGETVRGGTVATAIYINGIPASPVTTPGPNIEAVAATAETTNPAKTNAASASS
ncbi:MAG TPA: GGDEF domain-containing protein [Terriglobales bacterium]|nr:GGDEF domain-containing protein [Terriglobales bacterium]